MNKEKYIEKSIGVKNKNEFKYRNFSDSNCKRIYYLSNGKNKREKEEKKIGLRAVEIISNAISSIGNSSRADIARYIQNNEKASFEELRKEFNLNNNTLRFHLNKLQEAYIVAQPKERGSYVLGTLGKVVLQYLESLEDNISSRVEEILTQR